MMNVREHPLTLESLWYAQKSKKSIVFTDIQEKHIKSFY